MMVAANSTSSNRDRGGHQTSYRLARHDPAGPLIPICTPAVQEG